MGLRRKREALYCFPATRLVREPAPVEQAACRFSKPLRRSYCNQARTVPIYNRR
jgi:hypothetical protein